MDGEDNSMSEWKNLLEEADDEYLIGLANKGILKRAYKDKEETAVEIIKMEKEAEVKVGEETVSVRYPLGDSQCSCPSRSICRHIVLAILVLKETVGKEKAEGAEAEAGQEELENNIPIEATLVSGEVPNKEVPEKKKSEKILEEIAQYPLKNIKKILGVRQFQNLIGQIKLEQYPKITYSSVITVKLPEQDKTVKLLSPLEYSSCTCHKKEFCVHKASAVLWCQLEMGQVTKESLIEEAIESVEFHSEQIKEAAGQMKEFLEELLGTGLSRTSPDILDYLERLAIISHNANLPKYEGYFRALFDSYKKYFQRKASFQTRDLMLQITRLYRRIELLLQAANSMEIREYAGEFKAEYHSVGSLDLIGIAIEHFASQTGYAGETVYFLEENTKEWYTYTIARPVFYEKGRGYGKSEKGQAPWGLMIPLEELSEKRIHLSKAKCDDRNRLSSSQETTGVLVGERNLTWKELEGWYYQDFQTLFLEQIGQERGQWLRGQRDWKDAVKLVLVQPDSFAKAEFSETDQKLSMILFDKAGLEVVVEVVYSKREEEGIRYLERIRQKRIPAFLGKVYLRDGRIRMYPVALMDRKEIRDEWV